MLTIHLEPHYEEECVGEQPPLARFLAGRAPLYHQWRTAIAENILIINAYTTGTGKTKAALLRLLRRVQMKGGRLDGSEDNVLLIAPTNELLAQHARDVRDFCERAQMPYRVLSMSRASLDEIKNRVDFSEDKLRQGAALHALMENPRKGDGDRTKQATIFVVNPDIFYYAFYFLYNRFDRIPLFQDIFTLCNYIIIDEFHYYNPKQLANFLFFMRLSQELGYVDGSTKRQFCLLTATPDEKVNTYLSRLDFRVDRIDPRTDAATKSVATRPVPALSPVHLHLYSIDELRGTEQGELDGLLALVEQKRLEIGQWLRDGKNGAIISSSLWRIEQLHKRLLPDLREKIGRITGPELAEGRREAAFKPLILATPTVDIGYNFDRGGDLRQNIDFLFFDARSGDEFIQRLGRAGRVLGKRQQDIPSEVYAVVDPELYKALQQYDQSTINREELRRLAEEILPKRNDLYAYLESGAIAEAFLPLYRLRQMEATAEERQIQSLFESVRQLFAEHSSVTYQEMCAQIKRFLEQERCYRRYETIPQEKLQLLEQVVVGRKKHSDTWLEPFYERLKQELEARRRKNDSIPGAQERYEWILSDLRDYCLERARFSFREYFQPPQALISDPRCLHTSKTVSVDDALRIVRYYHATYFASKAEWEKYVQITAPEYAKDALVFCNLKDLREPGEQLRIGLKLDEPNLTRSRWQERFAYRLTGLYGLEIIALNNSHGLPLDIQFLLSTRFVPALVVAAQSRSAIALWRLQRKAQYVPYTLLVTFADGETVEHLVVLGTMALQIYVEIPKSTLYSDWGRAAREDDAPMIF